MLIQSLKMEFQKITAMEAHHNIIGIDSFSVHTEKHRSRVFFLGLDIYRQNKETFNFVDYDNLKSFLLLHDLAKDNFNDELFDTIFGRDIKRMSPSSKSKAKELIKKINNLDAKIARKFFKKNNISKEQIGQLMRIEFLADSIDRGMSPTSSQEFGRDMRLASNFILDPIEKSIVEFYENLENYLACVEHIGF